MLSLGQGPHEMDGRKSSHGAGIITLAGLACFLFVYFRCRPWDLREGVMIGAPLGRDFVNFWLGGRLALDGSLSTLTDLPAYNDLVSRTFDHDPRDTFIFSYPPHLLLPLAALACLPYRLALLGWTAANLAALAAATRLVERTDTKLMLSTCLSPAALAMVMYGHFGGLLALALATILRQAERRPTVAGLCLAGLTFKPQLALVVGLVLLGAGRWRCLAAGAGATLVLLGASVAAFGLDPWRGFLGVTLPVQGRLLTDFELGMLRTTISPYLGARALGLSGTVASAVQMVASAAAVALAVRALRRGEAAAPAFLAVALAAVIALPYANAYDLVLLAPALTPMVLGRLADEKAGGGNEGWAGAARLVTWIAPPLAWQLMSCGLPLLAVAALAMLAAGAVPPRIRPAQCRLAA